MDITQQLLGPVPVIRVNGELDRLNAPALDKAFRVHLKAGNHHLLLDLRGCSYIDSGGLAAIMTAVGDLRDDGVMAIVAPGVSVRHLLDVVGLYEQNRCAIFSTQPEAESYLAALASLESAS
jgi:anti-sigma B factor antagonist